MKYQNFIMRILCLLLILAAVVGYNSMQKKDTQAQESQEIAGTHKACGEAGRTEYGDTLCSGRGC